MDRAVVDIVQGVRYLVAGAFVVSLLVALTHWGVRKGTVNAFGAWARFVRGWSDPVLHPLERRLVRAGANPQDAPVWLVGVTVVAGLVVVGLVDWAITFVQTLYYSARAGALLPVALDTTFEILKLAIMVRVIASWISISPYSKPMRLVSALTDWLLDPIRRILPTFGMLDFSPFVAYLVLSFAEQLVMRELF